MHTENISSLCQISTSIRQLKLIQRMYKIATSLKDVKNTHYRRIFWTKNRRDEEWMKICRIGGYQTSHVSME